MKTPIYIAAAAALTLTACTDSRLDTSSAGEKTRDGAIAGSIIGAIAGIASSSKDDRLKGAIIGAAVGAGTGSLIGLRLDRQEAALRASLGNDNVTIVNTGSELIVTMPQEILFATDSSTLRGDLQGDLRALADNLRDYPDTTVDVIGHTDNTGDAGYNQSLSQRRAESVAFILQSSGVSSARIRAFGRGEDDQAATNLTEDGRAQNRRVEVIIRPIV